MTQKNVAILMFNDVEVLDFAGPFEVFSVTSQLNNNELFNVYLVAETLNPIQARNGLSINPDFTLSNCPTPNILIIPGGIGSRVTMNQPNILNWVQFQAEQAELVLSICTGSLILAKAGLLDGLVATTHHQALDLLKEIAPQTTIVNNQRFVDNGKILTAGGISAGIDLSLYVITRLFGEEQTLKTAQHMEYDWKRGDGVGTYSLEAIR